MPYDAPYIPFPRLLQEYVSFYLKEFGELKFKEIAEKVLTSNKVKKLMQEAKSRSARIAIDEYLATIHSIIHFTFSKAETIATASIVVLCKWEQEVGKPNEIADDIYLNKSLLALLAKCDRYKTHISNKQNFFQRFYSHLDNSLTDIIRNQIQEANKNNPYNWVKIALDSVKLYDQDFDPAESAMTSYHFATFMLNCGIIYLTKFTDEIRVIGWDYSKMERNIFVDLILEKAKEFDSTSIQKNLNAEFFDERDRVDSCLKDIALCIDNIRITQELEHLNKIAYNIYDEPMVIDFIHKEHNNKNETINLSTQFSEFVSLVRETLI